MADIKHNRFILSVPKDYTEDEIKAIRENLAEAREKNEDVILSNDIGVHAMTEIIPSAEEEKKDEPSKTEEDKPKEEVNKPEPTGDQTPKVENKEDNEDGKGTEGSSKQE